MQVCKMSPLSKEGRVSLTASVLISVFHAVVSVKPFTGYKEFVFITFGNSDWEKNDKGISSGSSFTSYTFRHMCYWQNSVKHSAE